MSVRTVVLRVVALALLLLLALVGVITMRTLQRLPDTLIYFVRDQGTSFTIEPVVRKAGDAGLSGRVRNQVAALVAGPSAGEAEEGLSSAVPQGVEVRSVDLSDGTLTVELSSEFVSGGGTASMFGRLNQLLYTLSQPSDVDAVVLEIEGETLTVLGGEGIIVEVPWVRSEHPELPTW